MSPDSSPTKPEDIRPDVEGDHRVEAFFDPPRSRLEDGRGELLEHLALARVRVEELMIAVIGTKALGQWDVRGKAHYFVTSRNRLGIVAFTPKEENVVGLRRRFEELLQQAWTETAPQF